MHFLMFILFLTTQIICAMNQLNLIYGGANGGMYFNNVSMQNTIIKLMNGM